MQLLGTGAIAAVLGAVVNGIINRRKLTAEATSIITQAAGGMVQNLQTDNGRLRAENITAVQRFTRYRTAVRKRDREFEYQLELHMEWHNLVAERLKAAGIDVPPPPRLELPEIDFDEDAIESHDPGTATP